MGQRNDRDWPGRAAWPLAGVLLALGCAREGPPAAEPVRPVRTMVVAAGEDAHVRVFSGKVEASRRAELAFRVPGLVASLPVKEGQRVAKGEIIGQLRPDEFQARLTTLQGQMDKARAGLRALQAGQRPEEQARLESGVRAAAARLTNARTDYDRVSRLVRNRAGSQAELDAAAANLRVAVEDHRAAQQLLEAGTVARAEDIEAQEAKVRALEGQVVEARVQLDDATLKAPFDGVIAKRLVDVKENVKPKQPVVIFQDVDEIEVAVDVPEAVMAADLRAADIVRLEAEFSGAPGLRFPVYVREMAQQADATTQTFRVRVGMPAPEGIRLLPGMTATVTLTYRRANVLGPRLLVPITAVFHDPSGVPVAWAVGEDGTVSRRAVTLGEATGGRVEVADGLQPGERIATAGATHLREGMKVRDLGDALGGGQP